MFSFAVVAHSVTIRLSYSMCWGLAPVSFNMQAEDFHECQHWVQFPVCTAWFLLIWWMTSSSWQGVETEWA